MPDYRLAHRTVNLGYISRALKLPFLELLSGKGLMDVEVLRMSYHGS